MEERYRHGSETSPGPQTPQEEGKAQESEFTRPCPRHLKWACVTAGQGQRDSDQRVAGRNSKNRSDDVKEPKNLTGREEEKNQQSHERCLGGYSIGPGTSKLRGVGGGALPACCDGRGKDRELGGKTGEKYWDL